MFGWHPRLSVDAYLGTFPSSSGQVSPSTYVSRLQERLQYAYRLAGDVAKKRADQNKKQYDQRVRENKLIVGDIVLVRKVNLRGRQKLADKWETDPFVIVDIPFPGQPVYKVRPESAKGPLRTLHRNMLLPFISIPDEEEEPKPVRKRRPRPQPVPVEKEYDADSSASESSSSSTPVYVIPQRRFPVVPRSPTTRVAYGNPSPGRSIPGSGPGVTPHAISPFSVASPRARPSPVVTPVLSPTQRYFGPLGGDTPTPPPVPSRPTRIRRAPQRFGEWVQ